MGMSGGGAFLPNDPPPSTGQNLTNPTITGTSGSSTLVGASITGATITGTVTIATGCTLTNPAIAAAAITGTVTIATGCTITNPAITAGAITGALTVASGATLTTPTILFTAQDVIATGATGSTAATITAIMPSIINCNATGVSGAGVNLPTGVVGDFCVITNNMTGVLNVYAIASTINGTTGTTAAPVTATGNRTAFALCTIAGKWNLLGNT